MIVLVTADNGGDMTTLKYGSEVTGDVSDASEMGIHP